ncbi:hypothetical protein AB2B41_05920 [Marimonas sp. MJW-29]|uniref:D-galactarate dehydratase n=1 Tax=Sulfitobacter sediminis TaxID=3234186 RepID=A0ABV3RJI6_9RHOB
MKHVLILGALALALGACAQVGAMSERFGLGQRAPEAEGPIDPFVTGDAGEEATLAPETAAPPPPTGARTAEALDTTTAEQRAAATAAPAAPTKALGKTVVSLGSPTEPGLWLKTPLVSEESQGRVTNPATGRSSLVTLIPLDGPATAGSRMSLAAMRLIEASLTDLTEVEVALEG